MLFFLAFGVLLSSIANSGLALSGGTFGAIDTLVSFWASTLRYTTDDVTYAFSHIHLRGEFGGLMFNMYIRWAILRP
jgi:hypothetical protein